MQSGCSLVQNFALCFMSVPLLYIYFIQMLIFVDVRQFILSVCMQRRFYVVENSTSLEFPKTLLKQGFFPNP